MLSLKDFSSMEKEKRLSYLREILSVFEDSNNILGDLSRLINGLSEVSISDDLIFSIYQIIFDAVAVKKGEIKKEELDRLKKLSRRLELIRQQEEAEKADADKLLENL